MHDINWNVQLNDCGRNVRVQLHHVGVHPRLKGGFFLQIKGELDFQLKTHKNNISELFPTAEAEQ